MIKLPACVRGAADRLPAGSRRTHTGSAESSARHNGVEERELLIGLDDIHRVTDVERDGTGQHCVAGTITTDHHAYHADEVAPGTENLLSCPTMLLSKKRFLVLRTYPQHQETVRLAIANAFIQR